MAIKLLDPVRTENVELDFYDKGDKKTKFKIKTLTGEQLDEVFEGKTVSDGMVNLSATGVKKAITYGLTGWEDMDDDIEFSPAMAQRIPPEMREELAWKIVTKSRMTEAEAKNS